MLKKPTRRVATFHKNVDVDVAVEIEFSELSSDDLVAELESRNITPPRASERQLVERLYYATRADGIPTRTEVADIHYLLASLYGRAS